MSNRQNYNNYYKQNNQKKEEPKVVNETDKDAAKVVNTDPRLKQDGADVTETTTDNDVVVQDDQGNSEALEEPKVVKGVVVDCEKLNVRIRPSIKGEILTTLDVGTEVIIHKEMNGFYKIGNPNGDEYCMKKFIKINQ